MQKQKLCSFFSILLRNLIDQEQNLYTNLYIFTWIYPINLVSQRRINERFTMFIFYYDNYPVAKFANFFTLPASKKPKQSVIPITTPFIW